MIVYLMTAVRWFHWRLQRPSLLLEEKVPQCAHWGGCGVRYTVEMIETFRRKRTAVTPHQSRFARQLLLKEKPLVRVPPQAEPSFVSAVNDHFSALSRLAFFHYTPGSGGSQAPAGDISKEINVLTGTFSGAII